MLVVVILLMLMLVMATIMFSTVAVVVVDRELYVEDLAGRSIVDLSVSELQLRSMSKTTMIRSIVCKASTDLHHVIQVEEQLVSAGEKQQLSFETHQSILLETLTTQFVKETPDQKGETPSPDRRRPLALQ
jgi:hypothetical protein